LLGLSGHGLGARRCTASHGAARPDGRARRGTAGRGEAGRQGKARDGRARRGRIGRARYGNDRQGTVLVGLARPEGTAGQRSFGSARRGQHGCRSVSWRCPPGQVRVRRGVVRPERPGKARRGRVPIARRGRNREAGRSIPRLGSLGSHGGARLVVDLPSLAVTGRPVADSMAKLGTAVRARLIRARQGLARRTMATQSRRRLAGHGWSMLGKAWVARQSRQGQAGTGMSRPGSAWQSRRGLARIGSAWQCSARPSRRRLPGQGDAGRVVAWQSGLRGSQAGRAPHGWAGHGKAVRSGFGRARTVKASLGWARLDRPGWAWRVGARNSWASHGPARQARSRPGESRPGLARHCLAPRGWAGMARSGAHGPGCSAWHSSARQDWPGAS
jgi:hypothetical protein